MVLDYLMNRAGVYFIEYVNPFLITAICITNPIISIYYFFKYTEEATVFGLWMAYTI